FRRLIIGRGWDGADRRSSTGSPSPLRSPAACRGWHANTPQRQPAINGHGSSRAIVRELLFQKPQRPGTATAANFRCHLIFSYTRVRTLILPVKGLGGARRSG